VEIRQYDVELIPRRAIKSQEVTDFIVKWTNSSLWDIDELPDHWVMYFNGSYNLKGAGAGVMLIPPKGDILKYAVQFEFSATNNIAEYEGQVTGLWLAKDIGIRWLLIWGDSQLIAKQVQKEYDCNNDKMAEYLAQVQRMERFFDGCEVWYVPHLDNYDVDHLAWIASSRVPTLSDVIVIKLSMPSVKPAEPISEADLMVINGPDQEPTFDWMNPIKMFLSNLPLLDDDAEVERIRQKANMYQLIDRVLYRQGFNGMKMRYISREESIQLLQDIHSGVYGLHSSQCYIIGKAFRHGFYWPIAKDSVMEVVTKCNDCQFF
jgi:hypothetical protein